MIWLICDRSGFGHMDFIPLYKFPGVEWRSSPRPITRIQSTNVLQEFLGARLILSHRDLWISTLWHSIVATVARFPVRWLGCTRFAGTRLSERRFAKRRLTARWTLTGLSRSIPLIGLVWLCGWLGLRCRRVDSRGVYRFVTTCSRNWFTDSTQFWHRNLYLRALR
jgi:hypothetical protein